jgi:adenylate cyclase class 2
MKEIEVKSKINKVDDFIKEAKKHGFIFANYKAQYDRIFLPQGVKFSEIVPGVPVVRIRNQDNQKITLTLKKRILNELDKIEHEIIIDNELEASKMLENMNFYEVLTVNKKRKEGHFEDLSICVDEVDDLGTFVEAEKICEDDDGPKIQEELFCLLESLGIKREDRITNGYDTLIYKKLKLK